MSEVTPDIIPWIWLIVARGYHSNDVSALWQRGQPALEGWYCAGLGYWFWQGVPLRYGSMYKRVLVLSGTSTGAIKFLFVQATSAGTGWVGYVYWFGWHRHLFFQDLIKECESLLSGPGLESLPLQVLQELGDTGPCLIRGCNPSSGLTLDTLQCFSVLLKGWVPDDDGIFQAGLYKCNVGKALAILGTTSEIPAYESELLMGLGDYVTNVGGPRHFLGE